MMFKFMRLYILSLFVPIYLFAANIWETLDPPHFPEEVIPGSDGRLRTADELFEAGLYEQAIAKYISLLADNIPLQESIQARFHLAQVYYLLGKYEQTINVLNENLNIRSTSGVDLDSMKNALYLKALAYKQMGQYALAIEAWQQYLNGTAGAPPLFDEEAQFEIGMTNYLWGKYGEAQRYFESLSAKNSKSRLHLLVQLYLSRIKMSQGHYREAANLLASLSWPLPASDPLHDEFVYLQGEVHYQLHDYAKALDFFKRAIPLKNPERHLWYSDTLYYIGWCHLKLGDALVGPSDQVLHYAQAEEAFKKMLTIKAEERGFLALGQCYLSRGKKLHQAEDYTRAEEILSNQGSFVSPEAKAHALLLLGEAAPTYAARDKFYRQLTEGGNSDSSIYGNGWYMRGLNDYENAQQLVLDGHKEEGQSGFDSAAVSFRKAFEQLQYDQPQQAATALKYEALLKGYADRSEGNLQAFLLLSTLMNDHPRLWQALEDPDEIPYLHGFFAVRLAEQEKDPQYTEIAKRSLEAAAQPTGSKFGDLALNLLAALQYRQGNYKDAEGTYLRLATDFANSRLAGEAWYWAGCCADKLNKDPTLGQQRRRQAFERYPQSPYGAEAYFTYYKYADYLQGTREAIKHLQNFWRRYPESPFLIEAQYLVGLDYKRDRKSAEGKWLRKKSLTEAIDAFQEVETQFDNLADKKLIPADKLEYYVVVRYRSILERALANLAIAEESQGAKRQIYLEYAEDVFNNLVTAFSEGSHPHIKLLLAKEAFPPIFEESSFGQAQTYLKMQKDLQAEKALSQMIDRYNSANVTRGYLLSRVWYEKGKLALQQSEYTGAQEFFKHAEEAGKGAPVLSTDQRLDLWIQQSLCCRGMNQFDNAILILSKVVNDDAISSLRLKAMYMRAETYEQQGRPELARKQLESMAKKGGIWAQKAQEKLEKDYGY